MGRKTDPPRLSIVGSGAIGIQPPRQLGRFGGELWAQVQAEYGITDRGGVELLAQCCEATDRLQALSEAISRDGEVVYGRNGVPRSHPSLKDETALRCFVTRTLERLGLNLEPVKAMGRPSRGIGWMPE